MTGHPVVQEVIARIEKRSQRTRAAYLHAVAGKRAQADQKARPEDAIAVVLDHSDALPIFDHLLSSIKGQNGDATLAAVLPKHGLDCPSSFDPVATHVSSLCTSQALAGGDHPATVVVSSGGGPALVGMLLGALDQGHVPLLCCSTGVHAGPVNKFQMALEIMGLQVPGSSLVGPETADRELLTRMAGECIMALAAQQNALGIAEFLDAKVLINGVCGLLALGGGLDYAPDMIALADAAGFDLRFEDIAHLSDHVPLLLQPGEEVDAAMLQQAGGMPWVTGQLLDHGLLSPNVTTILGATLEHFALAPSVRDGGGLAWARVTAQAVGVLRPAAGPISRDAKVLHVTGDMGEGLMNTSKLAVDAAVIEAPARVFDSIDALSQSFQAGELNRDFIAVLRLQTAQTGGGADLAGLLPPLQLIQRRGFHLAVLTDGYVSGAPNVPILTYFCPHNGRVAGLDHLRDGDLIRLDLADGQMTLPSLSLAQLSDRQPAMAAAPAERKSGLLTGLEPYFGPANTGFRLAK